MKTCNFVQLLYVAPISDRKGSLRLSLSLTSGLDHSRLLIYDNSGSINPRV